MSSIDTRSDAEIRVLDAFDTQDRHLPLTRFIEEFGDGLLDAVQSQNPAVYSGRSDPRRESVMEGLLRQPFPAQQEVVQAVSRLLVDENQPAAVINAEMGTGKTMMAIAAAAVMHGEGYSRTLVIAPPHLVYKWRREIRETVPEARVWILNGPDTLRKLMQLRAMHQPPSVPEFFVMGRVRMRMGFNWKPAFITRKLVVGEGEERQRVAYAACPKCGAILTRGDNEPLPAFLAPMELNTTRRACPACGERLWTLVHRIGQAKPKADMLREALTQIPTIGDKTAHRLVSAFGEDLLTGMLEDNVFEFINLMDTDGDLFFNDRQARRMERAMANMEFAFGQGGLLHHSDRGSQYASAAFQKKLADYGMACSMSRMGNCWDNAPTENWFNSFKNERVHGVRFETRAEMTAASFEYIEVFYNRERLHSTLGYQSPAQFLKNWIHAQQREKLVA